jgi:isoleucyl-tRNA synthetase
VEKLSTWYVRRSRRRFWKNPNRTPTSKPRTRRYTRLLSPSAKLIAPAMPFLADELYQNLVRSVDETAPESVHLAHWPQVT